MSGNSSDNMHFDENDYARPNQRWVCGRAAEGKACPLGPTHGGGCRSAFECAPYRQDETWVCARTKSRGGACDEGPLPDGTCCRSIPRCRPVRNALARRGVVSFCVFVLALGVALIMVASPPRKGIVSPGPLTSQHSRVVVNGCNECHEIGEGRMSGLVHAAFDAKAANMQSELCMKCHRDLGSHALQPHSQPSNALAKLTDRLSDAGTTDSAPLLLKATKLGFGNSMPGHRKLACATCHREHHGTKANIALLTDHQCQTCHVAAFDSFGHGHPEFSSYPYQRRTRLYFDHLSHYGKHFEEAAQAGVNQTSPRSCAECHEIDSAGQNISVREFEKSCASCHAAQIEDGVATEFVLAAFPGLDVETLKKNDLMPGDWPSVYPLHVEAAGELTPWMRLLLQSHKGFEEITRTLDGVDLRDLRNATPEQLQAAEKFVWMLKGVMHDVVGQGQGEIQQRLGEVLSPRLQEKEVTALVKQIPLEMLMEMQKRWLPRLAAEVTAHRNGEALPAKVELPTLDPIKVFQEEKRIARAVTNGWYLRESDLSLCYRPTGHADVLMKTLLDSSVRFIDTAGNQNDAKTEPMQRLFAQLSSPYANGRCMKCHTADILALGGATINWQAYRASPDRRAFTRFQHASHVKPFYNETCLRCHKLNFDQPSHDRLLRPEFVQPDWSLSTDPHRFASNFSEMKKASCAECHAPRAAGDSCLTCHNYHVR